VAKKFEKSRESGKRLKQNHIKLRETKLNQYHITLPKGVVEALNYSKGDVFKIMIIDGNITLLRSQNLEEEEEEVKEDKRKKSDDKE